MSKSKDKVVRTIKTIPINEIRFLNPRVRNRRNFQEIVQSIAKVGLKRPITVSPRTDGRGFCKLRPRLRPGPYRSIHSARPDRNSSNCD